ncbi:MAG: ribonuclease P protein component [Alkalilacustris sp.]
MESGRSERPGSAEPRLSVLPRRADFLLAARARRQGTAGFLLQARQRDGDEPAAVPEAPTIRFGLTASKKVGNAVVRNRARRRLRALAREVLTAHGRPGWDYVLVGRPEATVSRSYAEMRADLIRALRRVHQPATRGSDRPPARPQPSGDGARP